jgi:probable HAF family extracellular repeat protein
MRRIHTFGTLLALAALVGAAEGAPPEGDAFFIPLPPGTLAYNLGANGFVVGGALYHAEGKGPALHWMPTSGVTEIGGARVAAVSRDGKTLVGDAFDPGDIQQAAIWTGGKSWRLLGSVQAGARPCDTSLSGSFGASDDARVIVGLAWDGCSYARAFRWEESTGMVDLCSLGGESTRANGVSGDGRSHEPACDSPKVSWMRVGAGSGAAADPPAR